MQMAKKILVLVFSDLKKDARVSRQINFLKYHYHVTLAFYDSEPNEFEFIKLNKVNLTLIRKAIIGTLLLLRRFNTALNLQWGFSEAISLLKNQKFDLIIANDIETLPLAFKLKTSSTKILFDAHEYAPRHFENIFTWRLFFQRLNIYLCKNYIPQVDGMMTLGQNIADEYEKNFGVKPVVITNAPDYQELHPKKVDPKNIRLVHQGIANHSRKIELMIAMMKHLPENYSLDLILLVPGNASVKTRNYINELRELASFTNRIRFLDPIPYSNLVKSLNVYDIGIILVPPINFNYANGLPNKFFELVQARVSIAIGPSPEMTHYLTKFKLGVVSDSFEPQNLASKIMNLSPGEIDTFKTNAGLAAKELSAESNGIKLNDLIKKALEKI